MRAGHQHRLRGARRKKNTLSNRLPLSQLWLTLAILAALLLPASGQILAQSGFVPFSNSIISLDVSPDDGSIVLAGTLNVPVPAGIYRSTDGGHTWSRANVELPPDTSVASIRYDPQDGNRVLAADGGVGNLFISEDGGLNWRQEPSINQVLTINSGVGRLFARIEDGQTVFYAGTRFDGVVRSADGGQSWEWYGNGLAGGALRVRVFEEKDGALYAGTHDGVWRLTAESTAWQRVNLPAGIIARGMTTLDGRLYVGTFASGLYLSDDGYNWIRDPSFPAGVVIFDLAISNDQVIVGTNVGLWTQSVPDWVRASVNGTVFTNPVYRLASSPTLVGVTYAGTEQDGVLRTIDSGATFLSSAQITPLDPAEVPGVPTPTPTVTPSAPDTPTPTETPTVTATPDPNAPTATPTETPTVTATPDPNAPTATPTETPTVTATRIRMRRLRRRPRRRQSPRRRIRMRRLRRRPRRRQSPRRRIRMRRLRRRPRRRQSPRRRIRMRRLRRRPRRRQSPRRRIRMRRLRRRPRRRQSPRRRIRMRRLRHRPRRRQSPRRRIRMRRLRRRPRRWIRMPQLQRRPQRQPLRA